MSFTLTYIDKGIRCIVYNNVNRELQIEVENTEL